MARISFFNGVSLETIPPTKSTLMIEQEYMIAGLRQLRKDTEDLAAFQGVDVKDLQLPAALLLGDFADLLQLDERQRVEILGLGLVAWLHQVKDQVA